MNDLCRVICSFRTRTTSVVVFVEFLETMVRFTRLGNMRCVLCTPERTRGAVLNLVVRFWRGRRLRHRKSGSEPQFYDAATRLLQHCSLEVFSGILFHSLWSSRVPGADGKRMYMRAPNGTAALCITVVRLVRVRSGIEVVCFFFFVVSLLGEILQD